MIDKILVAVDRFPRDKSVVDSAVTLAKATGATLMLLQVLSEKETDYPVFPTDRIPSDRNLDLYREPSAQCQQWRIERLRNLAEKAIAAGVKTEHTQLIGNPGQTICEIASNWSADLVVVGNRGLKGIRAMILSSVSNYVTHHAPCSVLVVHAASAKEVNSESLALDEKMVTIH